MRNALLLPLVCFWLALPVSGAEPRSPAEGAAEGLVLRFGLVADVQYADKPDQGKRHFRKSADKFKAAVADWGRQDLAFVVSLGDLIDGHGPASAGELRRVAGLFGPLAVPVRHVLGNHCLEVDRKTLLDVLGLKTAYYDFSHGDWRFVVLDGMDVSVKSPPGSDELARAREYLAGNPKLPKYNGAICPKQLAWLKERLSEAGRLGQKAIVLCHHPVLPESSSPANVLWNHKEVLAALTDSGCVVAYFCGHEHSGGYAVRSGIHHVTVPGMVESPDDSTGCAVVELRPDRLGIQGLGTVPSRVLKMKALDSRPSM